MAEVDFRDGRREIPDYLYEILIAYEDRLYRLTFAEAVEFANRLMLYDIVATQQERIIGDHFRRLRSG